MLVALTAAAAAAKWWPSEASALEPTPPELNKAALKAHEAGGPLPRADALREEARGALHTSLATSAFADSASEALGAARSSVHGVPDSLLRLVLENEKVARAAAAEAQTRAQASWDAVSRFEHEAEQQATGRGAGWHDQPIPIEWAHVSSQLFNPALLLDAAGDGRALVAVRQQIYNEQRVCSTCHYHEEYYLSSVSLGWFRFGPGARAAEALTQHSALSTLRDTQLFGNARPFDCAQLEGAFNFVRRRCNVCNVCNVCNICNVCDTL